MDYTLGNTHSKDFHEFLINGVAPPNDSDARQSSKRTQKQPKLSTIKTGKSQRPASTNTVGQDPNNNQQQQQNYSIQVNRPPSQQSPNRSPIITKVQYQRNLMQPIPEENNDSQYDLSTPAGDGRSFNDSSYFFSNQKSDSSNSYIGEYILKLSHTTQLIHVVFYWCTSFNAHQKQQLCSNTSDPSYRPISIGSASLTGANQGARLFYRMISQQDEDELQNFIRKMFSFFTLKQITLALWIVFVYNNVPFTQFVKENLKVIQQILMKQSYQTKLKMNPGYTILIFNFFIFAISAFLYMTVLMMVHTALDFVRKPPLCNICYLLFTLSECWVIAFLLATTDGSTVFLFTQCLSGMVLAITVVLYTESVNWLRGSVAMCLMIIFMFVLSISFLNYTDMITIFLCMFGGLMFGIFLLNKAFMLTQNKYSHALTKDDYVIASLTIYVDFGFVLLIMLFVMLATIKQFTS